MPTLKRVFLDYDLGLLGVIAELWGVELHAPNQHDAAEELAAQLLHAELVSEVAGALPEAAGAALETLRRAGRLPLAQFLRQFGELRAMGQAKRDREQPWRNQPSIAETLWYRAFIARAFFAEPDQPPQEFVFIPDDLQALLPTPDEAGRTPFDWGAPLAIAHVRTSAAGAASDDVTTLLAYLQIAAVKLEGVTLLPRHRETLGRFLNWPEALDLFVHLAIRLGLAEGSPLKPEPTKARPFLEAARAASAEALARAWRDSKEWNDLWHVPGLVFEGAAWRNDPYTARQAILNLLREAPPGEWWPLEGLVQAVKVRQPDFQRPAGDYDSWYIRDATTKAWRRGFEYWDSVDGALVQWLVQKPLCWLGLVEIGTAGMPAESPENAESKNPAGPLADRSTVFRITPLGAGLLAQAAPEAKRVEENSAPIEVKADGTLRIPAAASRYDRFQAARVCNWLPLEQGNYVYRLSPASLSRAAKQGIKVAHILAFLQKSLGESALPPSLVGALHRWERAGQEAAVKETVVLKLKSPELLETLQRTPGVKRYLGAELGPALVEVRQEDVARLREALAELGILAD